MALQKFSAPGYNRLFDNKTGLLVRWGNTPQEDPSMCPVGPEIADIEISTICHGIGKTMETRKPCSWCYKSNTGEGENMSLQTFAAIFDKFPKSLTQIAFGIGDINSNPALWDIMSYCRVHGVVPNLTTNGMGVDSCTACRLAAHCGAVAVSHYGLDDICFDAIKNLTDAGLKQVNIHKLLSKETLNSCYDLIDKVAKDCPNHDKRVAGLKAIVFLLLKPKGDRNKMHPIDDMADYKELLDYAKGSGVAVGMDSCSAPMALKSLPADCIPSIEPCESTLFSIYLNVKGEVFPCSFTEGTKGWEQGIDMKTVESFDQVWYHPRLVEWRNNLLKSSGCEGCSVSQHCRSCPVYDVTICQPKPYLAENKLVQIEA